MWLILIIVAMTFLMLLYWDYMQKLHRVEVFKRSGLKGPPTLPLLGCGLDAISVKSESLLQYFGDCHQQFGKTFRLWILNEAQVFTIDVRHFETILTSTKLLQKGQLYDMLRPWLADGLLLSADRKWHQRRKVFTPAFHFNVLEDYVRIFDEQSTILVERLKQHADGVTVLDLFPIICLAALDVITETAMGVKVQAQLDAEFSYVKALKSVVYIQANRMLKFSQRYDWMFCLTAPGEYRKMIAGIRTMHDFTIKVIEERRAALQKSKAEGTYRPLSDADADIVGSRPKMALLDILLQASIDGKPLSNEDIREEVDTFMFEGDDTTTSGVSHALYSIARHPEVQRKLIEEIQAVMGKEKSSPITMEQLHELKYMDCVIKETMRLYPPVPAIGRKTDIDLKLDNGVVIPANTSVYLVLFWAHRDPELFPDPETFKPERFETVLKDDLRRNTFAYVPFSAGPRNCIGQKFAILEMKTMIAKVLRYYEVLPLGAAAEPMFNFVLRSSRGINIGLRSRI